MSVSIKQKVMLKEEYLQQLVSDLYEHETLNVYDHAALAFTGQAEHFESTKCLADQLVREKLARYADDEHALIQITNFGRYWNMKGGYEAYLRDGQCIKEKQRDKVSLEKEKLLEARLRLTHYRITGFWLALIISSIGFILSVFNLYLLIYGRK